MLRLDFEVDDRRDIDFSVMFVAKGKSDAVRLYGPTHRARSLRTALPCPADGTAYLHFSAFGAWFRSRVVRYRCACEQDEAC